MEFNEIYEKMRKDYEEKANCIISDASDSAIKLKTVAGQISKLYEKLAFVEKQAFLDTATDEYLVKHGEAKGIFKKDSTKSVGEVTFFKTANNTSAINIPFGTLCACSDDDNLLFEVTKSTIIPANETSGVCKVRSVEAGNSSIVAPTFVNTLVSPIFGIDHISNSAKIGGGSDCETDEQYRARILDAYSNASNGCNAFYYEQWAKSHSDVWFAKACPAANNVINIYVENSTHNISDTTISTLQTEVSEIREIMTTVNIVRATKKSIDFSIKVKVISRANEPDLTRYFTKAIDEIFTNFNIGQDFSPTLCSSKFFGMAGILDVIFVSPTASIAVNDNEIAHLNSCAITFVTA